MKCLNQGHSDEKHRGSSAARTQDPLISFVNIYDIIFLFNAKLEETKIGI